MIGPIPSEIIDQVRHAADIVSVVGRKIKLIKKGRNFWGVCPFHGDTDPSLKVDQERGTWHCFGCGAGGSVFNFVMLAESLPFPDAVRFLAESFGVALPEAELTPEQARQRERRGQLLHVLEISCKFFGQQLHSVPGRGAYEYISKKRSIAPATVADFALGYAPDAWDGLLAFLNQQKIKIELAIEAGLVVPRENGRGGYDRFRNRVMFPIRDSAGKVISFGGRALGDDPAKYVNGPETALFRKSHTLYNLDKARPIARNKGRVLLVEGYFDVVTLASYGIGEVVAPMGTALTEAQARLLSSMAAEIVLVFDGDDAGRRAAHRGLKIFLEERLSPLVLWLPKGEDPDSLVRREGAGALEAMLERARPLVREALDDILRAGDQGTPEGKSRLVGDCSEILSAIKDHVARSGYMEYVAGRLNLNPALVAGRLGQPKGALNVITPRPALKGKSLNSQALIMELALSREDAAREIHKAGILHEIDQEEFAPIARAIVELIAQGRNPCLDEVLRHLAHMPDVCATISGLAENGLNKPVRIAEQIEAWQVKKNKSASARINRELAAALRAGDMDKAARLREERRQLMSSLVD